MDLSILNNEFRYFGQKEDLGQFSPFRNSVCDYIFSHISTNPSNEEKSNTESTSNREIINSELLNIRKKVNQ